jgi:hypothetical protein
MLVEGYEGLFSPCWSESNKQDKLTSEEGGVEKGFHSFVNILGGDSSFVSCLIIHVLELLSQWLLL